MSQATLVVPEQISIVLRDVLQEPRETAGVLLVGTAINEYGDIRLLGRELHLVPDEAYRSREVDSLTITSGGYVPVLARAEKIGATALWFHTHPGPHASPYPSSRDHRVDDQLADLFRLRAGSEYYGSVICAFRESDLEFTGHVDNANRRVEITRLWEVGRRLRLRTVDYQSLPTPFTPELFDRNVRAFGGRVQQTLGEIRPAIVGCGGTGSAVAEQLVRLGVRHLVLIDPDILSESNLTRVYGSTANDPGEHKARVLSRHLSRIASEAEIDVVIGTINKQAIARKLIGSDIIFGCTDDNAGRLVLSRLASFLLMPVIDCGVLLSSDSSGLLVGIDGRVTILTPGDACLVCRDRINLPRAQAEVLSPDERQRRQDEGYAPALAGVEPAVVAFTTMVAAVAVGELLERLIGFGPEPTPSEVLVRFHEREFSTNIALPRPGHYCDPAAGKIGLGDSHPFLEQTWGD